MSTRRADDIRDFLQNHPDDVDVVHLANDRIGMLYRSLPLPDGWGRQATDVVWILEPGYPVTPPDCFWIDEDTHSPPATEQVNTQIQACPMGTGINRRWVSWHVNQWNAAGHDLENWLSSIRQGIREATGKVP